MVQLFHKMARRRRKYVYSM